MLFCLVLSLKFLYFQDNFGFPVYHSLHDTFHYVKTFMDPDFHIHRAIAQVMAFSVLALADDERLPMNATKYAEKLSFGVKALVKNHGDALRKYNITPGTCKDWEFVIDLNNNAAKP